jgi:hypothetical protein
MMEEGDFVNERLSLNFSYKYRRHTRYKGRETLITILNVLPFSCGHKDIWSGGFVDSNHCYIYFNCTEEEAIKLDLELDD